MRVYADTNVYVDLFEDRHQDYYYWGEFARQFFQRVREKQYVLVISDWVYDEIKKVVGSDQQLRELLNTFEQEDKIFVERTPVDVRAARALSQRNVPDALHVILAKKANAIYLVTRDVGIFEEFRDTIRIVLTGSL